MLFIHPKKGLEGRWEVAWSWLPYFLAADRELHKLVDKTMTEEFKGSPADHQTEVEMNQRVKDIILAKYPIIGLPQLLDAYLAICLEEKKE